MTVGEDLFLLLQSLESMEGPPPDWVAELSADELVMAARWIRTRLATVSDQDTATAGAKLRMAEAAPAGAEDPSAHLSQDDSHGAEALEAHCRALVKAVLLPDEEDETRDEARWGIDFGTARSKVAFRDSEGLIEEAADSTWTMPSILAIERNGDRILFGKEAVDVSRDAEQWNVSTSMKCFLVGKRIKNEGMPPEMTTERVPVLFLAWLLHSTHRRASGSLTPLIDRANLSLPLAKAGTSPQLRDFFLSGLLAKKSPYQEWLTRAFRMAQLIAITYKERDWPSSVKELLLVLALWEQKPWKAVHRHIGTISEPAAVIGDFEPVSLPEGLTMVVDCGAGTTDVSVFWRRGKQVFKVVEHSKVVGGDSLDIAIADAVLSKRTDLMEFRGNILTWAREAKPGLIMDGSVEFDPDFELGIRGGIPVRVNKEHARPGVNELAKGVYEVVSEAITFGDKQLRAVRPRGDQDWPSMAGLVAVWYLGGSSELKLVPHAIDKALKGAGVQVQASKLDAPDAYAAWNPETYLLMACAVGASRPDLISPEPLKPKQEWEDQNSDWD